MTEHPPDPATMLDLRGRVVVVTGAGGGVGAGIARRFLAAGATVVANTRSTPVESMTGPDGHPMMVVQAELTDPDGPGSVIAATLTAHGRIDALVNNAGIQPLVPFLEIDDDRWQEMLDVNLTAVHRLTRAAAEAMGSRPGGGSVVHVASIEGRRPTTLHGHYATAKAALLMHAKAAALSLGPDGIRVNAVLPGLIDRPGLAADWPDGVDRWQTTAPLRRLGTPDDVGDACVFLCSDLARWITGAELVVDGGMLTTPTW